MSLNTYSSSEDSNDSYHTIFYNSNKLPDTTSILKSKWEAVESTLYNEKDKSDFLKSDIIHECYLWKESFTYLRVKGTRLDTEKNIKRCKLRKNIISTVVNELIMKIAGEGLNINTDNEVHRPAAPKKESYFERGKQKQHEALSNSEIVKPPVIINLPGKQNLSDTSMDPLLKPPLRSILKKSPIRVHGKKTEERKQRSHLPHGKTPILPKINNVNNWLNRSERNPYYSLPPKKHYQKKKIRQERLILPPITPNIDFK